MSIKTFADFIDDDEEIHRSVRDFLALIEEQGWTPQVRLKRGIRYWCSCEKQHNRWIDLNPMDEDRISFIWGSTCLALAK